MIYSSRSSVQLPVVLLCRHFRIQIFLHDVFSRARIDLKGSEAYPAGRTVRKAQKNISISDRNCIIPIIRYRISLFDRVTLAFASGVCLIIESIVVDRCLPWQFARHFFQMTGQSLINSLICSFCLCTAG